MKKITIPENLKITETNNNDNPFVMDPKGFFLIKIEDNKIKIGHVDNETFIMTEMFEGTDPFRLYKTIIDKGLVSRMDHAAYLGYEISKAKAAIDNNTKYEQE